MSNDPKYVRLSDRLSNGTLVDTYSHWGITGLDVIEFPVDGTPAAQEFVRGALRRGLLEGASKAEFEEIQDSNDALVAAVARDEDEEKALRKAGQEAVVVRTANSEAKRLAASRAGEGPGGAYDADRKRRQAILATQKELDDGEQAVADAQVGHVAAQAFGDDNPVNTAIHAENGGSSDALRADNGETTTVVDLTGQIPQTTPPVGKSQKASKAEAKARAAAAKAANQDEDE